MTPFAHESLINRANEGTWRPTIRRARGSRRRSPPVGPVDAVARALEPEQPAIRDLLGERLAVPDGNIGSAVPWMTRVGEEIAESGSRDRPSSSYRSWFCAARKSLARDVPAGERAEARLVECALSAGEHAQVVDQVLDHRLGIRPVHLHGRDEAPELSRRRREGAIAGDRDRGADERERADALGEVEREQLREPAPGRDTDDVRRGDAVRGRAPRRRRRPDPRRRSRAAPARRRPNGPCRGGRSGPRTARRPRASGRTSPHSIDAPVPMTSRTGGSAGSPNDSAHSSTPFASITCSAIAASVLVMAPPPPLALALEQGVIVASLGSASANELSPGASSPGRPPSGGCRSPASPRPGASGGRSSRR